MTKQKGAEPTPILFVHNSNDLYGADVVLLELVRRIDRSRFRPIVAIPSDVKHLNRLSVQLESENVDYRFVRMGIIRRKYFYPLGVLRFLFDAIAGVILLVRLIRREHIAVVHSNTLAVFEGAMAARLTGRPHVWHLHEIVEDPAWMRRFMHFVALSLSDAVVAVSEAVKAHLVKDRPHQAGKIKVIHNGIDISYFSPALVEKDLRPELGTHNGELLVGMIGRVCRWKGQRLFLDAAQQIRASRPSIRFVAVGGVFADETHYMEDFCRAVAAQDMGGRFVVSDFRTDIRDVMGALDIFVLPSTQPDPFPTVILEAMAMGKPVVAAAHGGPTEMVLDGNTGFLVRPRDANHLAEKILSLASDPKLRRNMGEAARERVGKLFRVERYVADFESLYGELLAAENARA